MDISGEFSLTFNATLWYESLADKNQTGRKENTMTGQKILLPYNFLIYDQKALDFVISGWIKARKHSFRDEILQVV